LLQVSTSQRTGYGLTIRGTPARTKPARNFTRTLELLNVSQLIGPKLTPKSQVAKDLLLQKITRICYALTLRQSVDVVKLRSESLNVGKLTLATLADKLLLQLLQQGHLALRNVAKSMDRLRRILTERVKLLLRKLWRSA
jgi:hypothetical protein